MRNTFIMLGIILIIILIHSCTKKDDNSIRDADGNVYTSVTIGTQVWMAENLKTTRYRNGDLIGTTTPATLDISAEATPKYQWSYDGDDSNVAIYGRLYTWWAVTDSRNVCPTGWHVPSYTEWDTLYYFLGSRNSNADVAGNKLKETGTTHWQTPNEDATNETGFTALPGGARYDDGSFAMMGYQSDWWSSTERPMMWDAYLWYVQVDLSILVASSSSKKIGISVRCIKDN
jgi:uncharacterized protein (TIGR02145 family)